MTISPPDNVNHVSPAFDNGDASILYGGVDTLDLAISLQWKNSDTFAQLAELKATAKANSEEEPKLLALSSSGAVLPMVVKPHGSNGYEWLLVGNELSISLGNWLEPKQRPSALASIRSEALCMYGPDEMVHSVKQLLEGMGARALGEKVSRLDVFVDVLLPESAWHSRLHEHFVTRAKKITAYTSNREVSGFMIGRGAVVGRLYDKPREIREQSSKHWMFDVWELPEVPEHHRIVRTEFQTRRTALKELGIDTWNDAVDKLANLWSYCSEKWLRLVLEPELHHTQQELLPWWECVQQGPLGMQPGEPLVRKKAIRANLKQLGAQSLGTLASIVALGMSDDDTDPNRVLDQRSFLHAALKRALREAGMDPKEFTHRVNRKRAKYQRRPKPSEETEGDPPTDSLEFGEDPSGDQE